MNIWSLLVYDVLKNLYQSKGASKNPCSSISLDEHTPTPKDKCYVVVNQIGSHYEVTISKTIDTSAIRCEECVNRRQAEHLAELARTMYRRE